MVQKFQYKILLTGHGQKLIDFVRSVLQSKESNICFSAWIDSGGYSKKFDIPEATQDHATAIQSLSPNTVIIGYNKKDKSKINLVLDHNYHYAISFKILLPEKDFFLPGYKKETFKGFTMMACNSPYHNAGKSLFKRAFDVLFSIVAMIIFFPLGILIGIGVKLSSPGPLFYRQKRIGYLGEEFTIWKFRTMKMAKNNEDMIEPCSPYHPRKTPFGHFLRKTNLDEIPQFYNVLTGDMSLVGPRPERPYFVDKFQREIPYYMLRHQMPVGITGLGQIHGFRGSSSIPQRLQYDMDYIKNWSLWSDIRILFMTLWKGFTHHPHGRPVPRPKHSV